MKKLTKDKNGVSSGAVLIALIAVMALVLLYLSGVVNIGLPSLGDDKYEETVNRHATDVGIKVPIQIRLTFKQDANTESQEAIIGVNFLHKHDSADSTTGDVVPDAELINGLNFNTKVGNVGDTDTIYTTNGNTFQASDIAYNGTMTTLSSINLGLAQNNYKVWTKDTTHTPPSSVGTSSEDNSAIYITMAIDHYRKGTGIYLSGDTVRFLTYYSMPDYNEDGAYTESYTYYLYIPFDDFAHVEDIKLRVWGYHDSAKIEWTSITAITHTWWDFPIYNALFPGANLKLVRCKEVSLPNIVYTWRDPWAVNRDNSDTYGSHTYTYKVR